MSYDKFKANVWSKSIQLGLERKTVFANDCLRKYEGEVKNIGDSVTIIGAGEVTTRQFSNGTQPKFDDPELVASTSQIMTIKHLTDFNFMVPDIDQAQGAGQAIDIYTKKAETKIANDIDTMIAGLANDKQAKSVDTPTLTASNVLTTIDDAIRVLWENDVPANEKLTLYVSPKFYMLLKQNYQALDTNNSEMIKRGAVAMYSGVDIKLTNNLYKASSKDYLMLKTNNAIAFANPLTKVEAYRPDAFMSDAVKGVSLYDAKIVAPKEMIVLKASYSA